VPDEFVKGPTSVLDYKFDFGHRWNTGDPDDGDWLAESETISSKTVDVTPVGVLVVDSSTVTDSSRTVTAWLSAGALEETYTVRCTIVTSASRTDSRQILVRIGYK
jgi:hypothetical protein